MGNKIAIVVDSSSGIYNGTYPDVFTIPLIIQEITNGRNFTYKDQIDITPEEISKKLLAGSNIKTASSIPGDIMEFLNKICDKYEQVFVFPCPTTVSGAYNVWKMVIEMNDYKNVKLFKNPMLAAPAEWIVRDLIEARNKNILNEQFVNKYLEQHDNRFQVDILVPDAKYVHRGGRVKGLTALIVAILGISVVFTQTDKAAKKFGQTFTLKKGIKMVACDVFKEMIAQSPLHRIKRVGLFTNKACDPKFDSEKYLTLVKNYFKNFKYEIFQLTPVIYGQIGPNYVGVAMEVE